MDIFVPVSSPSHPGQFFLKRNIPKSKSRKIFPQSIDKMEERDFFPDGAWVRMTPLVKFNLLPQISDSDMLDIGSGQNDAFECYIHRIRLRKLVPVIASIELWSTYLLCLNSSRKVLKSGCT